MGWREYHRAAAWWETLWFCSAMLATLEHGVQEVNPALLFEVIEQTRQHDAALADALARLTDDFEYDEILRVIQRSV